MKQFIRPTPITTIVRNMYPTKIDMPTAPSSEWQDGWYAPAKAVPSPNFGPRPANSCIDLIILHSISLPPGEYGGQAVQELFTNQLDWDAHPYFQNIRGLEVSSHFFIRRDGELLQFVSCNKRAWHAGQSCWQGQENCNDYSVGIELEGLEGSTFAPAQYSCLQKLCQALSQHHPIRHLVGHEHVAPMRKFDPGSGFDWHWLSEALGWSQHPQNTGLHRPNWLKSGI